MPMKRVVTLFIFVFSAGLFFGHVPCIAATILPQADEDTTPYECDPNCGPSDEFCIPCCDPECDDQGCIPCPEFEPADDIFDIRRKIAMLGFDYEVQETWIFNLTLEEDAKFFLLRLAIIPIVTSTMSRQIDVNPNLPSAFSLTNVDGAGKSYLGPIRQTQDELCADCYAFATSAAAEGTYNRVHNLSGYNTFDFSEAYIKWELGNHYDGFGQCKGADASFDHLRAITERGSALETDCPYAGSEPQNCGVIETDNLYKLENYIVLNNNIEEIKTAIYTYGPVYATVYVTKAFKAYKGGIYRDPHSVPCSAKPVGYSYHSVALVGWNDNSGDGYWIVRNCWKNQLSSPELWGINGYMHMAYGAGFSGCEVGVFVEASLNPQSTNQQPKNPDDDNGPCFISLIGDLSAN